MFFLAGITITFFLTVLLFTKKGKTRADYILAFWLLFMTLHLTFYYLGFTEKIYQWPLLLGWGLPLPLVHGPFLYLYTKALTGNNPRNREIFLHFLPLLISYIYLVHFFLLPPEQQVYIFRNRGIGYEVYLLINLIAIIISGVSYVILSYKRLKLHQRNIHNQFSYEEKINLKWLQNLIYGIGIIWILVLIGSEVITFTGVVLFVFYIAYFGIRQPGIFSSPGNTFGSNEPIITSEEPSVAAEVENKDEEGKRKYHKSGLTQEMSDSILSQLQILMNEEKLFKESELTLNKLAERLNIHPNYVSQVINEREGKNFYEYINYLRIEEFIRLAALPESRQFTILSMALDCGFNSKSSFNKYFKKVTGKSPSDYTQDAVKVA